MAQLNPQTIEPRLSPDKAHAIVHRLRADPVMFAESMLGVKLWGKQKGILHSIRDHRITTVRSCHGSGKSFDAAVAALWFLYSFKNSFVITTAPTDRQVKGVLWGEIRHLHAAGLRRGALWGDTNTQDLKLGPKWMLIGFTSRDDATRFQGFHADHILIIVDEAAGVSDEVYAGVRALMSGGNARMLMIGNPTSPAGQFRKSFTQRDVSRFVIRAFDTPNFTQFGIGPEDIITGEWKQKIGGAPLPAPYLVTPEWVAEVADPEVWGIDSPLYHSRVLAEFPDADTGGLIPLSWIERARNPGRPSPDEPHTFGIDIGAGGSAESVVYERKGNKVRMLRAFRHKDTMQTVGEIKRLIESHKPRITYIDEIGIGRGVVDRLVELELPVCGVNVANPPDGAYADQFVSLKAQLYWELRKRFEIEEIDIDERNDIAEAQLASMSYQFTSTGKIKMKSKEEMAREGLPSPDRADAIMLCFADRVVTGRNVQATMIGRSAAARGYDG